jgi:hypothetical protein
LIECSRISTGLNSRNIYPNPIDSLKEYSSISLAEKHPDF